MCGSSTTVEDLNIKVEVRSDKLMETCVIGYGLV